MSDPLFPTPRRRAPPKRGWLIPLIVAGVLAAALAVVLALTLGGGERADSGPAPNGPALEQAYWTWRLAPLHDFDQRVAAIYPDTAMTEVAEGRRLDQARDKLNQARAAMAEARVRTPDQAARADALATQLRRLGHDRVERDLVEGAFRQYAADGETQIAAYWAEQNNRLNAIGQTLDLLDRARGHWRRDAQGFIFERPEDTRSFEFAVDPIRAAEARLHAMAPQIEALGARRASSLVRPPATP